MSNSRSYTANNQLFKPVPLKIAIIASGTEELTFFHEIFNSSKEANIEVNGAEFNIYRYGNSRILLGKVGSSLEFLMGQIHFRFRPNNILLVGAISAQQSDVELGDVMLVEEAFGEVIESSSSHSVHLGPSYLPDPGLLQRAKRLHYEDTVRCETTYNHLKLGKPPTSKLRNSKLESAFQTLGLDAQAAEFYQIAQALTTPALVVRGIKLIVGEGHILDLDLKKGALAAARTLINIVDDLTGMRTLDKTSSNLTTSFDKPHL